jgi:hypothetical protein
LLVGLSWDRSVVRGGGILLDLSWIISELCGLLSGADGFLTVCVRVVK